MSAIETCHLHEGRFFDPETRQYGYEVYCSNEEPHDCTGEREMFRLPPIGENMTGSESDG